MLTLLNDWSEWPFCAEKPRTDQVIPLPSGLTNQCFLLRLKGGQYVLRLEGRNSRALDINREAEYRIHRLLAAKGITPAIRYRSPDHHYWVRDYVPGHSLQKQDLTLQRLLNMVEQLRRVHELPKPDAIPEISVSRKAGYYWDNIAVQTDNEELLSLRVELQNRMRGAPGDERCLCHMDPTAANWIETADGKLVLLDWEYAAIGHPLWDLAALLQDADLSETEEAQILRAYGLQNIRQWEFARAQMSYLAALWYRAQGYWNDEELTVYLQGLMALSY